MNSQAISRADALSYNIFNHVSDPIDEQLSRSSNRIAGTVIGLFTVGLTLPFAWDIGCDSKKVKILTERTEVLQSMQLNPNEANYEKAKAAVQFEASVNQNVIDYTNNASAIKTVAAVSFFTGFVGAVLAQMGEKTQNMNILVPGSLLFMGGMAGGFGSSMAALGHQSFAGSTLITKNQELAEQYIQVK